MTGATARYGRKGFFGEHVKLNLRGKVNNEIRLKISAHLGIEPRIYILNDFSSYTYRGYRDGVSPFSG